MSRPGRPTLPDARDRERAATDFETSLAVIAGAGTGKTSLLVERLLNAIGSGRLRATDFAAITFTEKAAAEMRIRLGEGLEQLRAVARGEAETDGSKPAARAFLHLTAGLGIEPREIARRAREALEQLDLVKASTIHGFCAELLRAYPMETGVDPAFTVDTGARREALFREEWERFVATELVAEPDRADLWGRILSKVTLGFVEKLALGARERTGASRTAGLAEFRVPREAIEAARQSLDPCVYLDPLVAEARAEIRRVLDLREELNRTPLTFFEGMDRALGALAALGLDRFRDLLDEDPPLKKKLTGQVPEPGGRLRSLPKDEYMVAGRRARSLVRDLSRVDEGLLADLAEALDPFVVRAREAYLARGLVDFDGLLVLARDLLRGHADVRNSLKRRFRMILVDEFQDTDPLQYEIALFLAERVGESAGGAYEADLEPGKLFIVGDPKQSIYRFRGADYEAFDRAVGRIVATGGARLTLSANFRSGDGILGPVNALFEDGGSAWKESRYQPAYIPVRSAARTGGAVEVWTVTGGSNAEERREAEGHVLAREIRRMTAPGGVELGEILVLLRAFTSLALYLRPLREAGIPFVVEGGREFMERTEVVQLLSVLRALARPSDPVALLAFLRSPAAGATDVELAEYAAAGGRWHWASEEIAADRFPRVHAAFRLLRELREETRGLPAAATVRRVLARSSLLPLGAMAFEGPQRVSNLLKLAATAADLARDGTLTLNEILDALEELRAGDVESESPLAEEGAKAVRIMTIHKAKGLESRVVFLADLAREERPERPPRVEAAPLRLPSGEPGLALALDGRTNLAWVLRWREEAWHEEAERLRLLYVACTRAAERLVLLVGRQEEEASQKKPPPWIETLASWGYDPESLPEDGAPLCAGRVAHRILEPGPLPAPEPTAEPADPEASVAAYRAARDALVAASTPPLLRPSGEEDEERMRPWESEGPRAPARETGRERARAIGVVVHGALESWDLREAAGLTAGLRERAIEAAREGGVDAREIERESRALLESFLASPLAARLREVSVLGRELPVLLREEGRSWKGSLDLLYRDPQGEVVVADFKTDDLGESEALSRYAPQIGVYARVVERALGLPSPPRAELWMLRSGRIVARGPRG